MSDNNFNPLKPGDRVVCIADSWEVLFYKRPDKYSAPKKGDVLIIDEVKDEAVCFEKHNFGVYLSYFHHTGFAPVQDATDMEFEDTDMETANETEFAHLEEMQA